MTLSKKKILFPFLLIMYSTLLFATGPSYIRSEIKPISINNKGEILCKFRFEKNPMGAHRAMDVEYGICILKNDSIIQFTGYILKGEEEEEIDYELYNKSREYWDATFDSCLDLQKAIELGYTSDIQSQYRFEECNVSPFLKNDTISIQKLARNKKQNLQKTPQKALFGAIGYFENYNTEKVNILYDFGAILIVYNKTDDDYYMGTYFNYRNPMFAEETDPGYDYKLITGVLFLK